MKLNTPTLVDAMKRKAIDEVDAIQRTDHIVNDSKPCKVCNATGFDAEEIGCKCIGCDGSGKEYELIYGVEDGSPFAIINAFGVQGVADYCKLVRDSEMDMKKRVNSAYQRVYHLHPVCAMELEADGHDLKQMQHDGKVREIARLVRAKWGETFMTTKLIV